MKEDESEMLAKAVGRAAQSLGLSKEQLDQIIGRGLHVEARNGTSINSTTADTGLKIIRIYRALYDLVGGDEAEIRHWMRADNRHFKDPPFELIKTETGLVLVMNYLDAFSNKL